MTWVQIEIKGTVWAPDDLEEGEEMTFVHDKLTEALAMYDETCTEMMTSPPEGDPPEGLECIDCSQKFKSWDEIRIFDANEGRFGGPDWQMICHECWTETRPTRPADDDEEDDEWEGVDGADDPVLELGRKY
jgi:hypothetical protein